jgi:hypothetical protein
MQRRLSQETVDSQSWAIEILDALSWLPGRRIESVVRTAKINDPGDEVIILNFDDGTFAEICGYANWGEQTTSIGVAFSDIDGVER